MIKYIKDKNGFYIRVGLFLISFFVIPHSKINVPSKRFGCLSFNSCASYGYQGKHLEFWIGRTYFGFDIDHFESKETLQGYFYVDVF